MHCNDHIVIPVFAQNILKDEFEFGFILGAASTIDFWFPVSITQPPLRIDHDNNNAVI